MSVRFVHARAHELSPYVEQLRALEREIPYPIADGEDEFRIDHGDTYHPFFSDMGEAHFILALDGDRAVGTVAGVLREAVLRGHRTKLLYAADMKVARTHRGGNLARRMLLFAARKMVLQPGGLSWRLAYVAAMRGAKGDVTRTVRGLHLGQLARPLAVLSLYFTPPAQLAGLDLETAPASPRLADGLDLSPLDDARPSPEPGFVTTAGKKDLRLRSTGAPWPLVHLVAGPATTRPSWPAHLRACGEALGARGLPGPACFALDRRLTAHVDWLARHDIQPGAACTVYALSLTRRTVGASWVHLATSEI